MQDWERIASLVGTPRALVLASVSLVLSELDDEWGMSALHVDDGNDERLEILLVGEVI